MKKILLFAFCSISLFLTSCKKDKGGNDVQTIKIGGLFSLTGNWSSLGIPSQEAMKLALIDVNTYLEEKGSTIRLSTVVADTKLDTSECKSAIIRAFTENNVRYIIGPQSSAEVGAIKTYANDHNILVVSQGSTASSLAIPNDAIFRFCPGDAVEGRAMAQTMSTSGKQVVITLSRDDAGNKGLQQSVGASFAALGGQVDAINPYATTLTDYTNLLNQLRIKIQQHSATVGADNVAVYLASFDECKTIFEQAATDPIFSSVNWYGGDGIVLSSVLLMSNTACDFATTTHFFAPNFGLPLTPNPKLAAIQNAIRTNTGYEPDAYTLAVYDAMWVIAKTISSYENINQDFSKLKLDFANESNQHYGITGPVVLNANGDRDSGSFDYYGIVWEGGVYKWKLVGKSL
jgi:branched-chain amino acid transport system substrate-binding protein